jgi:hypothetical protein
MTSTRVDKRHLLRAFGAIVPGRARSVPALFTPRKTSSPAAMCLIPGIHRPYDGYDNYISIREEQPT